MSCNNKKLTGLITGNTLRPGVFASKGSLLVCGFVGACSWPSGYWISHTQFQYLDIQLISEGSVSVSHNDRSVQVPAGSGVIIPPGNTVLKAVSPGFIRKKHIGIGGPLCLHNLGAMNLDQMTVVPDLADEVFMAYFDQIFDSIMLTVIPFVSGLFKYSLSSQAPYKITARYTQSIITKSHRTFATLIIFWIPIIIC